MKSIRLLLLFLLFSLAAAAQTTLAPGQCVQICAGSSIGQPPPPPPAPIEPPPAPAPVGGLGPIEGRYVNLGNVDNLATVMVDGKSSFHLTTPYTLEVSLTQPRAITAVQDSSYRFDGGVQFSVNGGPWQGGSIAYNWRAPAPGTYRIRVQKHNARTERGQHIQVKPLSAWP